MAKITAWDPLVPVERKDLAGMAAGDTRQDVANRLWAEFEAAIQRYLAGELELLAGRATRVQPLGDLDRPEAPEKVLGEFAVHFRRADWGG